MKNKKRKTNGTVAQTFHLSLICFVSLIFGVLTHTSGQNVSSPQDNKPAERLKIGLVLSGGGARGFAHIGVLKVLEENRIPVDFIAGASIGGLVGSLYATGRTPAEMEQIAQTLDWEKLLRGSPAYENLTFRRKQDRRNIPGGLTLGGEKVKDLKLPGSLNPGHEIGLVIDNLMLPYSSVRDFNNLPIPFWTVATDMVNAETVVLKSGSLQQSLRATMAIPAVFAPVEINGKILADGGILNNIPTDVVKNMGADIILVVNIETQIGDREALEDLIGVLGQTITVATIENSRRSLRQADIIIAPDLKDYTTASFGDGEEIIKLGYLQAKQKENILKSLSLSENDWNEHLAARRRRIISETRPVAEFVTVEDATRSKEGDLISKQISKQHIGKKLDKKKLESDLTNLTGTRKFDRLGYELKEIDGKTGLLIRYYDRERRAKRKTVLQIGVGANNTDSNNTNFNLRGRLTFFGIGGVGSEWRNDFSIGSKILFSTEYFRPIGNSNFFIAPGALYENRKYDVFQSGDRLAEYKSETAQVGIDFGYSINDRNEVRLGYFIGNQTGERSIGAPLLPNISGRFNNLSLKYAYEGVNNSQIPTRGTRLNTSLNYYFDAPGASSGFPGADLRFNTIHPLGEGYLLYGFGQGGTSFGRTAPSLQAFTVGGLFNIGGYGQAEFRGSNSLSGGLGILRETYSLPAFIGGKIYLGGWYEGGSAFEKLNSAGYLQSVTGGALMETPLGPVFIGGSFAEGGRRRFYFSLGRFF
jgi:NTE family protein